jgi:hypothetical protein
VTGSARGGPALGEFLTALHDRLRPLSREDLVAVLGKHAERLPARERQAFLDIFRDPTLAPTDPRKSVGVELEARIESFAARVAAGEYAEDEGYRWDGYGWEEEETAWAPDADALFAEVGEVFVGGDLAAARAAYERLLAPFGLAGDDGGSLELWQLDSTDVPETLARYVRCVFETSPTAHRVQAVHQVFRDLAGVRALTLAEVSTTRVDPLPDLDAFVPGWIDALVAENDVLLLRDRVRLLVEAANLRGGVHALADVARRPGPHQGGVGLAWIDSLTERGRLVEARAAAELTLDLPGADGAHRARAADRLADLHARAGDTGEAVAARRRAWTLQPTRARLLALAGTSRDAGVLLETLAAEADALVPAGRAGRDRLGCELLLLAGRSRRFLSACETDSPNAFRPASPASAIALRASVEASAMALAASPTIRLVVSAARVVDSVVRVPTSWTSRSRLNVSWVPPATAIAWAPTATACSRYAVRSAPSRSAAATAGPRAPVLHRSASVVTVGWVSFTSVTTTAGMRASKRAPPEAVGFMVASWLSRAAALATHGNRGPPWTASPSRAAIRGIISGSMT